MELNEKAKQKNLLEQVIDKTKEEKRNTPINSTNFYREYTGYFLNYSFNESFVHKFIKYRTDYTELTEMHTACMAQYRPKEDARSEPWYFFSSGHEESVNTIKEFMELVPNIHIEILDSTQFLVLHENVREYGYDTEETRVYHVDNIKNLWVDHTEEYPHLEVITLLKITYDEQYSDRAVEVLNYMLGILFRNMAKGEYYFGSDDLPEMFRKIEVMSRLELLLNWTTGHGGHGTCYVKVTVPMLARMNDIPFINKLVLEYGIIGAYSKFSQDYFYSHLDEKTYNTLMGVKQNG